MTSNPNAPKMPRGGAFVIEPTPPECVLIPEHLSAEARLIAKTAEEFMRRDVLPVADRIEANDYSLMESLVRKAGTPSVEFSCNATVLAPLVPAETS